MTYGDIFGTLHHRLGLDVADTTLSDLNGRPQSLADALQPIRELISNLRTGLRLAMSRLATLDAEAAWVPQRAIPGDRLEAEHWRDTTGSAVSRR